MSETGVDMTEPTETDERGESVTADLIRGRAAAVALRKFAAAEFGVAGDEAFDAAAILDRLSDATERVLALHRAVSLEYEAYSVCEECNPQTWPCATLLALAADRSE